MSGRFGIKNNVFTIGQDHLCASIVWDQTSVAANKILLVFCKTASAPSDNVLVVQERYELQSTSYGRYQHMTWMLQINRILGIESTKLFV